MHTSSSTSAINKTGGLVPLSPYVRQLAYGDDDYIRSVFGTAEINHYDIAGYYERASKTWTTVLGVTENMRKDIGVWFRETNIRALDYWFPMGRNKVWFRHPEDAFAFRLKFGL